MLSGMEMMLAKMIGLTPEQMREQFTGLATTAQSVLTLLTEIRDDNKTILAKLEGLENGDGND
jgi:hypothetical protein